MFNNKVYHKIDALSGSVATLRAEGVKYNEIAEIESRAGTSLAQVIKLDGPNVTLQIFAGARGVDTAARVRFLGETMKVPFSEALLGRAFTGAGIPRDGGPAINENPSPIGQPSVNPAKRIMPNRMVKTNIPMIDLFNSLVISQKLPIFAKAGEPYNELLARIALQADSDVIVIGGMGLKYDEYLKFRSTLDESGALAKTVMFVHTAADPTVECVLVPDVSLAVAEKFALQGGVFGVAHGGDGRMFVIVWKDGFWFLRVGKNVWVRGPRADPGRFTKLAVTLKDRYLHFFVDDKEVFSESGPIFWEKGTAKDTFSGCFRFHRGSDSFIDSAKHSYLGEAKDYHAYSKATYPLKYAAAEYGAKGDGRADDTAAVQRAIDAAAEKTGEVVLGRGVYKVSRLQMRPGVTLSLADGAIVNGCVCARGVRDFTILGPGAVAGDMVFENAERAYVRRLGMQRGRCVVRDSKNVVFDGCRGVAVDAPSSTRVLVDGKLLRGKSPEDTGKERSAR